MKGASKEKEGKEMGHTIDDTSGSSGFGFSIKSYMAMITNYQPSCSPSLSGSHRGVRRREHELGG